MDDTLNLEKDIEEIYESSGESRIKQVYEALIRHAIVIHKGNRTKAAEYVGISVRTLRNKLQEFPKLQELARSFDTKGYREEVIVKFKDETFDEASSGTIRRIIRNIKKSTEVYHIRGLFNLQRLLFKNEKVQKAALKKLDKFSVGMCPLNRSSSEDLKEDIEIFIESGCPVNIDHKFTSSGQYKPKEKSESNVLSWHRGF